VRVGPLERLLGVVPGPEQAFRAPGRANLIGEHTDYNDGFVLPVALELATYVAGRRREGVISVRSLDEPGAGGIERYTGALVSAFRDEGVEVSGFEGVVASEVPIGAGLSSSAALEVALALALAGSVLEPTRLALLCQRAENVYLGTRSGIMDQLASAAGEAGHALLIDCRDVTVTPIPFPSSLSVLVVDSAVRRELAESEYNRRVAECQAAADALGVRSLRDAAPEQVETLSGVLLRRARHVVEENQRVLAAADALRSERLGELRPRGVARLQQRRLDQIRKQGHEDGAEHGRGETIRRCREVEADIGERGDEVEQHAEADRVGRDQPRIAQVPQHLAERHREAFGAHEAPFGRRAG